MASPRPASSDLGFFSKSKSSKPSGSGTTVTVTKRIVTVKKVATPKNTPGPVQATARDGTPSSSSSLPHKRKPDTASATPSPAKRPRISASPSIEPPSRASREPRLQSRRGSVSPARSTPARSVSAVATPDPPETHHRPKRRWWTAEDGRLGDDFMSFESVIRDNLKDYVSCASAYIVMCEWCSYHAQIFGTHSILTTSLSSRV